jgi:predicted XRE-type DNA-binding protein
MTIRDMIEALVKGGMKQGAIAEAVGVSQPTIHRALHGADVLYATGKKIESLYEARCGQPKAA